MSEQKDSSSIPVLLGITGAVLVSVGAGWLLLDEQTFSGVEAGEFDSETSPAPVPAVPAAGPSAAVPVSDIDNNLRKARLAADADILAYPAKRSALYFYGLILNAEPEHAVARAELETVLTRIAATVTSQLEAERFEDAYGLASLVAKLRPDHRLVFEVQRTLDQQAGGLVEQAMQYAYDGRDRQALAVLASAESLPGRESDYFDAVRDSIREIQESRRAAEVSKAEQTQQAALAAERTWIQKVRGAISSGALISPPGENARDYLAESDQPGAQKDQLLTELVTALTATAATNIDEGALAEADTLLDAADDFGDDGDIAVLRGALERAYIETEAARVVSTGELVAVKTVPARYPRRAEMAGTEGWVEVMFTVSQSGETTEIFVSNAEPEEVFNEAAMNAVGKWTFEPKVYRGQTINQRAGARLVFRLE